MPKIIYFDYQATTPIDPRVLETLNQAYLDNFANTAAGTHALGWQCQGTLSAARNHMSQLIGALSPRDLIFTSGATESNNFVFHQLSSSEKKCHIISQKSEHKSVLEPLKYLAKQGHEITLLDINPEGIVEPDVLLKALKPSTSLVSIMMVNNEIGTVQHIKELAHITKQHSSAFFHTDATQALGRIPINVSKLNIDFMSFSAHKFYGPKGIGGLYVNSAKNRMIPQILGGDHEFGLRAGTVNLPSILAMSKALDISIAEQTAETIRLKKLADLLLNTISSQCGEEITINGSLKHRIPHNLNLSIRNIPNSVLLGQLSQYALSSGSACATGSGSGSYVIQALGKSIDESLQSIRISLGRFTTQFEVEGLAKDLSQAILDLKKNGF